MSSNNLVDQDFNTLAAKVVARADYLASKIRGAAEAYYLTGHPIMSDQEFDALVDELRIINPNNPVFSVGWGVKYQDEVKLPVGIQYSLDKFTDIEDSGYSEGESVFASPKIDGMSVILQYDEHDQLKLACTRGDGTNGINITPKMLHIATNVTKSGAPNLITKGELYIKKSVFEAELSTEYANPRNAVAGIINRRDLEGLQYVSFISHEHVGGYIENTLTPYVPLSKINISTNTLETLYNYYRNESDYPIDGLVINKKIAFKIKTEEKTATIKQVNWTKSDRGQYCPVAELTEEVSLYGTKVSNVSCFHAQYVKENRIGPGAVVKITKAGEIIPHITKVIVYAALTEIPVQCYDCGSVLEMDGVGLYCKNSVCLKRSILESFLTTYFSSKGTSDMKPLIKAFHLTDFTQIARLDPTEVYNVLITCPGYPQYRAAAISNAVKKMHDHDLIDAPRFLEAFSLKNIGEVASRKIAPHLHHLCDNTAETLIRKSAVPSHTADSLRKHWDILRGAFFALQHLIYYPKLDKEEEERTDVIKFVMTGKGWASRKEIEKQAADKGYKSEDSVTKDTMFLVCADKNSNSSKMQEARKLGVKIINYTEFKNTLEAVW